jgi:hypothetical protein
MAVTGQCDSLKNIVKVAKTLGRQIGKAIRGILTEFPTEKSTAKTIKNSRRNSSAAPITKARRRVMSRQSGDADDTGGSKDPMRGTCALVYTCAVRTQPSSKAAHATGMQTDAALVFPSLYVPPPLC